jgi:hypothetical protein
MHVRVSDTQLIPPPQIEASGSILPAVVHPLLLAYMLDAYWLSEMQVILDNGGLNSASIVGKQGVAAPVSSHLWDSCAFIYQLLQNCVNASFLVVDWRACTDIMQLTY